MTKTTKKTWVFTKVAFLGHGFIGFFDGGRGDGFLFLFSDIFGQEGMKMAGEKYQHSSTIRLFLSHMHQKEPGHTAVDS